VVYQVDKFLMALFANNEIVSISGIEKSNAGLYLLVAELTVVPALGGVDPY